MVMQAKPSDSSAQAAVLNEVYGQLTPAKRIARLFSEFSADEILITSSFGTSSALLLYLVSQVAPEHPVYFINTQYHFAETLAYKRKLTDLLGLNVIDLTPPEALHARTRDEAWYAKYPDRCCTINKVIPLEAVQPGHTVWISGLMGFQNAYRAHLPVFEERRGFCKFQPLIDISQETYHILFDALGLPAHPLELEGYGSVGCTHCTVKGDGRDGRWAGKEKTECGLHL